MGSVLSRLFCGCCKYNRESASGSHSNEGNGKCTVHALHNPAGPPTPARENSHVETTCEKKTNIVTVIAINSKGSQIAKSDVAKDIPHDKCKREDNNAATIGSHTRSINSTDIKDVNRCSQNVSYLTISIDIATM